MIRKINEASKAKCATRYEIGLCRLLLGSSLCDNELLTHSSASLNYLTSISDLLDFRKANSVSDCSLRCFAATEVYIRKDKENLGKRKRLE